MSDDLSKVGCASERRPTAYEHANGAYDPDCAACREYAEPSPSDDIAKRMEALVRGMAKANGVLSHSSDYTEARAIVALLPEPVDADEQWAIEQVAAHGYSDRRRPDQRTLVEIMTACVQHGRTRALERDSREG